MLSVLCQRHGPPESLALVDLPSLTPGPGEVVVAVHAAGVNFPDTLIIENRYQFKPALPFAPGGEVAGTVVRVGPDVSGLALGDRVMALCGWGGFAEEVAVKASAVVRLPQAVCMDDAAVLAATYGTTWYALKERGALRAGQTLLVLGAAGGTGAAAIQLGKMLGARVIACASSPEKLELCRQLGADEVVDHRTQDLRQALKALTNGQGVDVAYDPVGGELTEVALRSMAWGGRLLVIGFASGTIAQPPLNLALLKGCDIVGVFFGAFMEREPQRHALLLQELLEMVAQGRLQPAITQRLPLEQAAMALRQLADRQALGKTVLTTSRGRDAANPA
ncbi:NADPH:quinone oxidoreductase family protein [Hydrogenophaga sp.]|uniref:NADPH:quinone oxidoreductase family protein n=1 Tax=Hydrogenophaga sp. TaxID=1904254 RepID=UPI003F721B9D